MQATTKKQTFEELMADTDALIVKAVKFMDINGIRYDLGEWVTIAEYTKRFGVKSTNVVTNWIRRGIVPAENVISVPELNDIRLIKAVPYIA
ncbi:hypothetical protein [Spirosoma radiotolerans]|uniref:Uncharacterized protein n=1 Tax=Spirosoma radiotolerans TaxID=1379870 RepID=A0A0E3V9B5_9BACT|nr:hypothetical protein [Spirosoma radiotolerans]AKD57522.1 hypothetical protein SD10_24115 [Spirosoma radiotolerans]